MPWPSVPYSNTTLRQDLTECFNVLGIPYLVLIDNNGNIITENGRAEITEDPDGVARYFCIIPNVNKFTFLLITVFPMEKTIGLFAFFETTTKTSELPSCCVIH